MSTQTTIFVGSKLSLPIQRSLESKRKPRYGLAYPLSKNLLKGGSYFQKESGNELDKSNLLQLIKTNRGDRFFLPDFGVGTKKFLFEPLDEILFENIKHDIVTSIGLYNPHLDIVKLAVFNSDRVNDLGISEAHIVLLVKRKGEEDLTFEINLGL